MIGTSRKLSFVFSLLIMVLGGSGARAQQLSDLYSLLGVSPGASLSEIKSAYRKKAFALHPDINPDKPGAAEQFRRVKEAYEILSSPSGKSNYNSRSGQSSSFRSRATSNYDSLLSRFDHFDGGNPIEFFRELVQLIEMDYPYYITAKVIEELNSKFAVQLEEMYSADLSDHQRSEILKILDGHSSSSGFIDLLIFAAPFKSMDTDIVALLGKVYADDGLNLPSMEIERERVVLEFFPSVKNPTRPYYDLLQVWITRSARREIFDFERKGRSSFISRLCPLFFKNPQWARNNPRFFSYLISITESDSEFLNNYVIPASPESAELLVGIIRRNLNSRETISAIIQRYLKKEEWASYPEVLVALLQSVHMHPINLELEELIGMKHWRESSLIREVVEAGEVSDRKVPLPSVLDRLRTKAIYSGCSDIWTRYVESGRY